MMIMVDVVVVVLVDVVDVSCFAALRGDAILPRTNLSCAEIEATDGYQRATGWK